MKIRYKSNSKLRDAQIITIKKNNVILQPLIIYIIL